MADREIALEELVGVVEGIADRRKFLPEICPLHTAVGVEHGGGAHLRDGVDDIEALPGEGPGPVAPEREGAQPGRVSPDRYLVDPVRQPGDCFRLRGEEMDLVPPFGRALRKGRRNTARRPAREGTCRGGSRSLADGSPSAPLMAYPARLPRAMILS